MRKALGSLLRSTFDSAGFTLFRKQYLPRGIDEYLDLSRIDHPLKVRVAFDVGANVGQTALRLNQHFRGSRIHCFEPISETFQQLQANVASLTNIQCHPCAMGAAKAHATAYVSPDNSELASIRPPSDGAITTTEQITVDTIDSFCSENGIEHIDILKTDTEGYDIEVLRGAEGMLKRGRVSLVVAECTFDSADTRHTSFFALHEVLAARGFLFFGLYEPYHEADRLLFANAIFKIA